MNNRLPDMIERNIWFYRYFTVNEDAAINRLPGRQIVAAVSNLADPYLEMRDGNGVVSEMVPDEPECLKLMKVRWTDHPGLYRRGREGGNLNLQDDEALSEPTHVRFFDGNIVGIDVNRSGPWPTQLRDYLRKKLGEEYRELGMVQIPDRTARERLARITHINSVDVRLSGPTLQRLPQGPHNYLEPIRALRQFGGAGVLRMAWKRWGRIQLDGDALRAMVLYFIEHANELDEKAEIAVSGTARGGEKESFSLRRDFVTERVEIQRGPNRRIDSIDAFRKIAAAFTTVNNNGRIPAQTFFI